MIDKLKLTSCVPNINLDYVKSISNSKQNAHDKHYDRCTAYKLDGVHIVTVKQYPRIGIASPICIEINPTRFKSFDQLRKFLSTITDVEKLQIRRIDYAVDINISVSELRKRAWAKGKMKRSDFEPPNDTLAGFDLGRAPEEICIYDKRYERLCAKKYKKVIDSSDESLTRIEIKQSKKKLPIKYFSELHHLQSYDPFKSLIIQDFEPQVSDRNRTKVKDLENACSDFGFQSVYKKLNSTGNFSKTYGKCLSASTLNNKIREIYRENLSIYFMSQLVQQEGHASI